MEKWQQQVLEALEHAEAQELATVLNRYFDRVLPPNEEDEALLRHMFERLKKVCSPDEFLWVIFWTGAAWQLAMAGED